MMAAFKFITMKVIKHQEEIAAVNPGVGAW